MKRALSLFAVGMLGTWATLAYAEPSGQTAVSTQLQAAVNNKTQNSGNAAAATSGSSPSAASTSRMTAKEGSGSVSIPTGTRIDATLATSLDAKRSKPGDDVEVRTEEDIKQDGKVVLKRGAHLVGHVTQARARAGGQTQSQLGIAFDHAILKDGQEVPFSAEIEAVASAQSAMMASSADAGSQMDTAGSMGTARGPARSGDGLAGGIVSNASSTVGATTGAMVNTATSVPVSTGGTLGSIFRSSGAVGGLNSRGRLSSNSSGVFGLEGLSIDSAASSATQGSLIVSGTKNVHLDSGTQLLLRTASQAQ